MGVSECCIYAKIMHSSLLAWSDWILKQLKYHSHNSQNRRSGKIDNCIFETYKNSAKPHGYHKHPIAADTNMSKMCPS